MAATTKKNIYEALIAAQAAIKNVGKNGQNKFDGYAYRGIDDVMDAVHKAFCEAGVVAVPEVLEKEQVERTSRKGDAMIHTTLTVRYTFYAEDGSSVSAVVQGEGMDRGDKSINKAMSGAYKYAMFQVLAIPTSEMIDSETESPEIAKTDKTATPKKTVTAKNTASQDHKITTDAARKLAKLIQIIDEQDKAWWPDTCNLYGIAKTTDIDQADYNKICQAAQARIDQLAADKDGDGAW